MPTPSKVNVKYDGMWGWDHKKHVRQTIIPTEEPKYNQENTTVLELGPSWALLRQYTSLEDYVVASSRS